MASILRKIQNKHSKHSSHSTTEKCTSTGSFLKTATIYYNNVVACETTVACVP